MELRFLDRSRMRLSSRRWRGRDRRYAMVMSGLEALWSQGLALRMALPAADSGAPRERPHAALRQWRAFVGVFLVENVASESIPLALGTGAVPREDPGFDARLEESGAEALYDVHLADLAQAAHGMREDDVLPEPLAIEAAADACDAPIERVLAIKVRGIPRVT